MQDHATNPPPSRPRLRIALCALVGLLCAAAGPFDRYQTIMWQEHTPTEVAGLARLGFTATKLRATSGQIDPTELANHMASALPWYLENVATDLYAPYHRYRVGRSVTAAFDEAKAEHAANPASLAPFERYPSLSDTNWLRKVSNRLTRLAREQATRKPLFYNLGDESGIADLAAAWDFDLGATSLDAMRDWLKTQYADLAALNAEWGTDFATWDVVRPETTDAALRRADGNYASWGDFKAWMDVAFARAVRTGTDALHAADPDAPSALEGAQIPGWGGYDYGLLAPAVDVMEIYDAGDAVAVARAANPNLIVLRTSFRAGDAAEAWRSLLQGGRGTIVWDEDDAIVAADGSPKPRGLDIAATTTAIEAVAPAIMRSRPDDDPVAVLVSQASFRIGWMLDRRPGGAIWASRSAGREYYEDDAWRASRRETLRRLRGVGIQPHLMTSLAPGALQRAGIRMLVLPDAIALSDAEVDEIRRFAAAGGAVVADTEPGLYDGHGRHRDAPPLAGIAKIPEQTLRSGDATERNALEGQLAVLAEAGIRPRATFRAPDGDTAPGIEARWFADGDRRILSIQPVSPYSAPARIDVDFDEAVTTTDLRTNGEPRTGARLHLTLDEKEPTIIAVTKPQAR